MKILIAAWTAIAFTSALGSACTDATSEPGTSGALGVLHAGLAFEHPVHDVTHVAVDVIAPDLLCGEAIPLQHKVVPIEEEYLPDWLGSDGAMHPFGDALFVLAPGDYRVCVSPLAGDEPSLYCGPVDTLATVVASRTTETAVYSQCSDTPNGAVDIVAGLNDPPHIDDLAISPGKFAWACETATISLSASDPNGDSLSYRLEVLEEPGGGLYTLPTPGPDFAVRLCTPGPWLLRATAIDASGAIAQMELPMNIIGAECPGAGGRCHRPNGSPGCNDVACCQRVCQQSRGCCQGGGWDDACAALAGELCQGEPAFQRGQFIDSPVVGLDYLTASMAGETGERGRFYFLSDEEVAFSVGSLLLGTSVGDRRLSPLDLLQVDTEDGSAINMARFLQTLDSDGQPQNEVLLTEAVKACVDQALASLDLVDVDWADDVGVDALIDETIALCATQGVSLTEVSAADAKEHLDNSLSQSGIFRKNISKSGEWVKDAHAIGVVEVYLPPLRSNGDPSLCDDNTTQGVPYERWLDTEGEPCDPREVESGCEVVEVECRDAAKPLVATWQEAIDIHASSHADFLEERWAYDIFVGVSRDDGTTWKRTNLSRMADLSSFDLETTGEAFPGFSKTPRLAIVDNKVLIAWTSTFCKSGNPRYSIQVCPPEDPDCIICHGGDDNQTCEPDYHGDDPYYVEDIWGVAGSQQSVNFDEVDDVAHMGIGEIPYSCLWTARGVIVTQKELDEGRFASLAREDDPATPDVDETQTIELGDIVWYKPERLTSGRRDAYIPTMAGARDVGFAIAWQEDPEGLRPGKGKGPGEGWSGAISNHKTDIWYSRIAIADFDLVDEGFVPGGDPDPDRPGLGRPKALVPMTLPVRVTDNDMVNTDTLKVEMDADGMPIVDPVTGGYVPVDPLEVEHGNGEGTRRYAYLAKQDPLYAYAWDTLDLCDTTGANTLTETLPDPTRPRWYRFVNNAGATKTVCITSDGRLLDGDISASRPNLSLLGYVHPDGSVTGYVLLAYEETKGLGESPIHDVDTGDGTADDGSGEPHATKPDKQDLGKNVVYHSFEFDKPDLVSPGHIINLPALCAGLYPEWCDDPNNVTCTCTPGEPVPLYFEGEDGLPDPTKFMQYRTEIARRTRFIAQMNTRMGPSRTIAVILYKQGQEGQGRPADLFARRVVVPEGDTGNPYRYENIECPAYLDETWPAMPGYANNVWGEPTGDRLCGGYYTDPVYGTPRRAHTNLSSTIVDLSVPAGPDDTPQDDTDDRYGTDKVLLWSQTADNLFDESTVNIFGNSRSHRGFFRTDFLVIAYAFTPNWASARHGHDRYNFYIRRSFDGGVTWTTSPEGEGVWYCREYRTDPETQDPPVYPGFDPECEPVADGGAELLAAGTFEPSRNISEIQNNKETSSDPRLPSTPLVPSLDGRDPTLPVYRLDEDYYQDEKFWLAWGTGESVIASGGNAIIPEAPPLDIYYTRTADWGDSWLKVPWNVNPQGNSPNYEQNELVWRYDWLAKGDDEEQGEVEVAATPDGAKMWAIWLQLVPSPEDPDAEVTRWYPWEPEETTENDIWFRRLIDW